MMMMMKASVALVTFFLLLSPVTVLASQSYHPDVCCFKFYTKTLHANVVESYKRTSSHCAKKGVIFTRKDKQICADSSMEWVKKLIINLDKRASPL